MSAIPNLLNTTRLIYRPFTLLPALRGRGSSSKQAHPMVAKTSESATPQLAPTPGIASGSTHMEPRRRRRLQRRLRRALRRSNGLRLGSAEAPYTPGTGSLEVSIATLRRHAGGSLLITTDSPRITEQLSLLTQLDHRHSVSIDVVLPSRHTHSSTEMLAAAKRLVEQGLAVRLVIRPGAKLTDIIKAAYHHGIHDVIPHHALAAAHQTGGRSERWTQELRRLRLAWGFPLLVPCRG